MWTRIGLPLLIIAGSAIGWAAPPSKLEVSSTAFRANEDIPTEYTCDGANAPPPLAWSQVPPQTRSIAVLVDDPDAPSGAFTHWLVTGIPPATTSLDKKLPAGAVATGTGPGDLHYTGPCPPSGRHHYRFHVYALDTMIQKPGGRADFMKAIEGHVLAQGELVGMYEKRP